MSRVKQVSLLLLRVMLTFLAVLLSYSLSTLVMATSDISMTREEETQAAQGLIRVSSAYALVFSFLALRARWYGLKLVGGLFLVFFGVETFMAQIETLYFNSAVQMEMDVFVGIVAAGAVRAALCAVLVVLVFSKLRKPPDLAAQRGPALPPNWPLRFAALSVLYVMIYFLFGYFVAWQWEETRLYYSGTTALKPFLTHFWDLLVVEDPIILPFQLLRGALWTSLAILIVRMIEAKRWETALAVALTFAVLLSVPLGSFPNPYMPPAVAQSHFYEIFSSMLVFGGVAGWFMYAPSNGKATYSQSEVL